MASRDELIEINATKEEAAYLSNCYWTDARKGKGQKKYLNFR